MKRLAAAVLLLGLASCSSLRDSLPHGRVEIGGFGVTLAVDTRPITNPVADLVQSGTALVGLNAPPEKVTPRPAAPATPAADLNVPPKATKP